MTRASTPKYRQVEAPFIRQLQAQGWEYLEGDVDVPYLTERETFRQVLLTSRLRAALRRINLDDEGQPWLDEARVTQAAEMEFALRHHIRHHYPEAHLLLSRSEKIH